MSYFNHLPQFQYNDKKSLYLLAKAKIIKDIFDKIDTFYPYVINEGETPQLVAFKEYGSAQYDWVVMFSNDIIDPYYDWPLTTAQFYSFLRKKYDKSPELTKGDIVHYKYTGVGGDSDSDIERKSWVMSVSTYTQSSPSERSGWEPVYVFDYELEKNEEKRKIQLLQPTYLTKIENNIQRIFR